MSDPAGQGNVMDILSNIEAELGPERDAALEQFLDLTRRPGMHNCTVLEKSVPIVGRCAFEPNVSPVTRHLALRCLNNILYLSKPTRQLFVDSGFPKSLIELMQSNDADDVSLSTRLMLLCSIDTTLDHAPFFERENLAEIINTNISRHARDAFPSVGPTLNLLSTLAASGKNEYRFLDSLPPLLEMLDKVPIPSPPLGPLVSLLISSLFSIPFDDELPSSIVDKLVDILDLALPANINGEDADKTASPLMALLLRAAGQPEVKLRLSARMIASDHDRTIALGRGDSLPHKLIRLSAEITARKLKYLTAWLLFKLSDEDPKQLIANVGYGYGIGIAQSLNLPLSPDDLETGKIVMRDSNVNPITGQRMDAETADSQHDLAEMTQEEKEREAERLFVLLRATGAVNIENPVAQAIRSGHAEVLQDDYGDEMNS
ncbi:guanine nucleotide exchange factor [Dactylonectria macrodidyma]|uniref:Guanine nucleotide exchange factor n=1 Tax=Dactylonectria macrodidyma TaxID=307937 RepID=A0A9P9J2D6_9HYPO|nr:guanine nucleotide exchange factor [Dactylonectria macrodidyma]